jgi:hypothetical protein
MKLVGGSGICGATSAFGPQWRKLTPYTRIAVSRAGNRTVTHADIVSSHHLTSYQNTPARRSGRARDNAFMDAAVKLGGNTGSAHGG